MKWLINLKESLFKTNNINKASYTKEITVDLESLVVFDPRTEGIDYHTYMRDGKDNEQYRDQVYEMVSEKISSTQIGSTTLWNYLFEPKIGYFAKNPSVKELIFINGRLIKKIIDEDMYEDNIAKLALENNGFPYIISRPLTIEESVTRKEFVDESY